MSSIKRDVKKKAPPSTGGRDSVEIQPTVVLPSLEMFGFLSILVSFLGDGGNAIEFERAASETGVSV
jgi:hypothetical protein